MGTVLVGGQPHGGGLDAHGHVLGDDGDVRAGVGEPDGDGEDPGVVVPQAHAGGQDAVVRAVELDPQGAALVVERDGAVEATVVLPQDVEEPQGGAREVAELGVVALGLELGDDDDGQHDGVLVEAPDRARVGKEDGGVQDVGAQGAALPVFHSRSPGPGAPRLVLLTLGGAHRRRGRSRRRSDEQLATVRDGPAGEGSGHSGTDRVGFTASRAAGTAVSARGAARGARSRAGRAGSRFAGSPASRPRRSSTRSGRTATGGSPRGAARRRCG